MAELLVARVGELGIGDAGVVGTGDALAQARVDEPVDEPGDPGAGEPRALRQRRHRQTPAVGL
jgi:hypothetical protein